jgi:SHS2 domain-containing protein
LFRYKYIEDIAPADVAFEAWADSWEGLFRAAAEALTAVMVNLGDLKGDRDQTLDLNAATIDELLFEWLSEIVYLKDVEGLLVKSAEVDITESTFWEVHAILKGDTLDDSCQRLGQDVKAVTYHLFEVSGGEGDFRAKVVLDI